MTYNRQEVSLGPRDPALDNLWAIIGTQTDGSESICVFKEAGGLRTMIADYPSPTLIAQAKAIVAGRPGEVLRLIRFVRAEVVEVFE